MIRATNSFLAQRGWDNLVEKGKTILTVQIVTSVAAIMLGALTDMLGDSLGGLVVLLVVLSTIGIIGGVFMINYLKASAEALRD